MNNLLRAAATLADGSTAPSPAEQRYRRIVSVPAASPALTGVCSMVQCLTILADVFSHRSGEAPTDPLGRPRHAPAHASQHVENARGADRACC